MHIIPFTFKRAHHATLKLLRPLAAKSGLTPARFDLLYALHVTRHGASFQYNLAKWLGVTRATVCRMVRSLQDLGILELEVDTSDRRYRRILVTRHGRRSFARIHKMMRRRTVGAIIRAAYTPMRTSRYHVGLLIAEIVERVQRFSRGIHEHTTLYPLEPLV